MSGKVYKEIEVVGTSNESFGDAVSTAVSKASQTVRNLDWFEVTEVRGRIKDGQVDEFQVALKLGFRLE